MIITKELLDQYFDIEAELLDTGSRREIFLFRGFIVKQVYKRYKRVEDFNHHEFQNYQKISSKLPDSYQQYFQKIYDVIDGESGTFLISEAIMDNSKQLSKSVKDFGPVNDYNFWKQLDKIVHFLAEEDLCLTDLHAKNILVHKKNNLFLPIIIDYKTMGNDFSPWQIQLLFHKGRINKMLRKQRKMKEEFAINYSSNIAD